MHSYFISPCRFLHSSIALNHVQCFHSFIFYIFFACVAHLPVCIFIQAMCSPMKKQLKNQHYYHHQIIILLSLPLLF